MLNTNENDCCNTGTHGLNALSRKTGGKTTYRTMLEHVYRRVSLSQALDATFIATCDEEIRREVDSFWRAVIMTADTHERASDRVAEAIAGTGRGIHRDGARAMNP